MSRPLRLNHSIALPAIALGLALGGTPALAGEDPLYVEVSKLVPPDAGFADEVGEELAIDGDTLVVAGDDFGPGAAYVYERNAGGSNAWGQVTVLRAPDSDDGFGRSMALEGDLLVVGMSVSNDDDAVYTFERDVDRPGSWQLTGKLIDPGGNDGNDFGVPALQGPTLLVGAGGDDEGAGFGSGAVFVYERDTDLSSGWRFLQKLIASDAAAGSFLGFSVDLDGDTLVAGAPSDDQLFTNAGAAYVFERGPDGLWSEQVKLISSQPGFEDNFGWSVAIEGDTIAVGAPSDPIGQGAVYIFGRNIGGPEQWGFEARIVPDDPDPTSFGHAVDLVDGRLLVGARASGPGGRVHLFERDGAGQWIETFRASAEEKSVRFGSAVGLSGSTMAVGSMLDDDGGFDAGAAYVYEAVAHPEIAAAGACPGELTLELTGATPSGPIVVARSESEGISVVPGGKCAGIEVGLEEAKVLAAFLTDSDGTFLQTVTVPEGACGQFLQAVDRVTCGAGALTRIP